MPRASQTVRLESRIMHQQPRTAGPPWGLAVLPSASHHCHKTSKCFQLYCERLVSDYDRPYKASKAWIENFKAVINGNQGGGASNTRVKVALLDTGIDTEHDFFQESCDDGEPRLNPRIKEICSWVDGNKGQRTTNGRDECGHGTSVANLLLDLCPNIDLYVARVSKTLEFESGAAANIKNVSVFRPQLGLVSANGGRKGFTSCQEYVAG